MQPARPQKFRPTGLANELRSSSGTTGFTAAPESRRGGIVPRTAGQPSAPAMPKFSTDSPFVKPAPRKPEDRPSDRRPGGDRGSDRPDRGGPSSDRGDRRGGKGAASPAPLTEILVAPEIGVMKLKPKVGGAGGRGRDKKGRGEKESEIAKAAKKKITPSKVFGDADEFRRPIKPGARKKGPAETAPMRREPIEVKPAGPIILTGPVTVAEFAEKLGIPTVELIKKAFLKGKAITINQLINFELAEEIDLLIKPEGDESDIEGFRTESQNNVEDYVTRPPVVTIMGHVDHGKTTVLDYYRRSRVVEGEFGGITQHIGAYQVETQRGTIVFLDTPGHEAFTAMRARGVKATDIVVLVVSADDGVMPQTVEAINHAKAANVPLIVAINKIDLPQANPERVRTELMQYSVLSTNLGGDTEFVEVSAKLGTNMDALLEIISLQSEVLELKSNPKRLAEGIVIESHVDPLRGAVATLLVQQGTLNVGDIFVVGQQYGRVRAMYDDRGRPVQDACLARPVELIGLTGAPDTGEILLEMPDERTARDIAEKREQRRRLLELGTTRHVSLEGLHDMIADGQIKELNVILKADVQGSVEAIMQALDKISANEIRVRVLHNGTGPINESDINLALASSAIVIGFNIRPESRAEELAQREHVQIKTYRIIYELLEEMEKALVGMLEKKYTEQIQGKAEVRQVFRVTKVGTIAGCMVSSGEIIRGTQARLLRDNKVVYEGKVGSLRRLKEDVTKVTAGYECGIGLDRFIDIKDGDIVETFTMQEVAAELTRN
jgi:translation initiation factor IF-2